MAVIHRVLLVKDDQEQVSLFTLMLARSGCEVSAVASAEAALSLPLEPPYDLLLTDMHLLGMKGDALVCTWHNHSPATRTMLMSADPDVHTFASACHADGWFRKPIDIDYFRQLITAVIASPPSIRG